MRLLILILNVLCCGTLHSQDLPYKEETDTEKQCTWYYQGETLICEQLGDLYILGKLNKSIVSLFVEIQNKYRYELTEIIQRISQNPDKYKFCKFRKGNISIIIDGDFMAFIKQKGVSGLKYSRLESELLKTTYEMMRKKLLRS